MANDANTQAKALIYDADGYELITKALQAILNQYPGLMTGERIGFSDLQKETGIAFYPTSGAIVESVSGGTYEDGDITGHVDAVCQYPFVIVYRAAPRTGNQKINVMEWLGSLGSWLDKLTEFPELTGNTRTIKSVTRTSPAYLANVSEDGTEDWQLSLVLRYRDEFDR